MTIEAFVFDAYGTLYDVHSVSQLTEEEFPGRGDLITQIWRLKQLEYTWLRSQMQVYRDFWEVSEESLVYTLKAIGLSTDKVVVNRILDKYLHLDPYPDCLSALDALKGYPLAILSNGNQEILDKLVKNTGLDTRLQSVISVDKVKTFKPHPTAYELVEQTLGIKPENVMFVSSNSFDATAAKNFGFQVAWIERVTPEALAAEVASQEVVGPSTMFKLLRMQLENFGMEPDHRLTSLSDLASLIK
ncbi:haloacid dehalogenase type II [Granulosicoccus antarcticus]|uniref:(S)-2-haloacid dehalogenase n=1 Tax=Granulosicoccus antarcticus IMCC3135 TaxID=1192854 RepID=A0A2Z2NYD9_9GAMM|nr:haloacid dehalogenase type II [Granulosicoccus antarcticus]ASJ74778.1 (S)-2-haloacid dehalogenase [Granulosicoccus antarcticus IMCC3135]